jgi:hypothetical protein
VYNDYSEAVLELSSGVEVFVMLILESENYGFWVVVLELRDNFIEEVVLMAVGTYEENETVLSVTDD